MKNREFKKMLVATMVGTMTMSMASWMCKSVR